MITILPPADELDGHPEKLYKIGFAGAGETPESGDVLQRAELGKKLSNIVENISDPLIIALNGGWGSGKTWFLKHWAGAHKLKNGGEALAVYISAFNHDYLEDPLPTIIGAIDKRVEVSEEQQKEREHTESFEEDKTAAEKISDFKEGFKQAKTILGKAFPPFTKILLKAGRKAIAAKSLGLSEYLIVIGDALGAVAEEETDAYWKTQKEKQNIIEKFRAKLEQIAQEQPLVIIIDELDRAKPDYALSFLETAKHFFNVKGIKFILGVNLPALGKMVRHRYGLDEAEAGKYLERFINFSMTLPDRVQTQQGAESNAFAYCKWAMKDMNISPLLKTFFLNHIQAVSRNNAVPLRDAQCILSKFTLILASVGDNNFLNMPAVTAEVLICLLSSEVIAPDLHKQFSAGMIGKEDVFRYYGTSPDECQHLEDAYNNIRSPRRQMGNQLPNTPKVACQYLESCKFKSLAEFQFSQSFWKGYSKYAAFMWIHKVPKLHAETPRYDDLSYLERAQSCLNLFNVNLQAETSATPAQDGSSG